MRIFPAIIALLAILLSACGQSDPPAPARRAGEPRIAALSPAIAVILRDLGARDHVIARHGWDLALDRSLPVAGDQAGLDYEVLLRVQPTHVLLEWGARPIPPRLEQLAQQHNWSNHNYRLLTLDDIERAAQDLHTRFIPGEAWEESPLAARWRTALARRDGLDRAGRILLLYSVRPPGALGPGSAHHQVLESIGGTPALHKGNPYITLDAEDVLRLAPDAIILIRPRARDIEPGPPPAAEQVREQLGRIGTLDIPAVRTGRIALIDHPLGQLPSTSLIEIAEEMAEILEEWTSQR